MALPYPASDLMTYYLPIDVKYRLIIFLNAGNANAKE